MTVPGPKYDNFRRDNSTPDTEGKLCPMCHGTGKYTVHITSTLDPKGYDQEQVCNHTRTTGYAQPANLADGGEPREQILTEFKQVIARHDQALKSQLLELLQDEPVEMRPQKDMGITELGELQRYGNKVRAELRQAINTVYRGVE